jgi:cupin fold WbuC family metalloprotein
MIKITHQLVTDLSKEAAASPRLRKNYNFHREASDPLQRMLNALELGTYVQPHRHQNPDKREAFILLSGSLLVVEFDEHGAVSDHSVLSTAKGVHGAEIAAATWHTIVALEPSTVVYELKDGPWDPADDKDFAPWAPAEGEAESAAWLERLIEDTVGTA